ncbi:MAG: anthranilate synthase component I [Acidimicrobiales bacterium]
MLRADENMSSALIVNPEFEEFTKLCKDNTIVPVWTEIVADTLTPVGVFGQVARDEIGFLFESVEGGERWGRYSFVGRRPLASLTLRDGKVSCSGAFCSLPGLPSGPGILSTLDELLSSQRSPRLDNLPPLHAGVVGYLGYDVVREVEPVGVGPNDDLGLPDAELSVIGQLVAFDHWRQSLFVIDNVEVASSWDKSECRSVYDEATFRLEELANECCSVARQPAISFPREMARPVATRRTLDTNEYARIVEEAKAHIKAGDIFQAVLSQRFDFDLGVDPFQVYRALRLLNPSPYLYYMKCPELTVVGSSPEPMVRLRDGTVTSRPIAGSRPRGGDAETDSTMERDLLGDSKEVSEHVMLVDLARNDVGRVVEYGTEVVDELMTVERYSHIMHLTSQVSGHLAEGMGPIDVIRATLPAGTLSGAPKVRAMQLIDELEPTKRGPYGGVVGYFDFSGNLDTAIAIRTMVVRPDGTASVQAGAGIVADSDPVKEDEECQNKAAAVLSAVGVARYVSSKQACLEDTPATKS